MLLFLALPIAGLLVGVPSGFFKEKFDVSSWKRWLILLSPFAVTPVLPLTGALIAAGSLVVGQQLGASLVAVGLTGGIATGKSSVSQLFVKKGAEIVDADVIAREVVLPGRGAYNAIVKNFGTGVLHEKDKTLNRAKLGAIIFADPAKRKVLNACTHKFIMWEMFKQLVYQRLIRRKRLVVFDAPLLFETNLLEHFCYPTIVVACSEKNELVRLMKRDNLSLEDAQKRIQAQMKLHDKVQKADLVIQNDGSLEDLLSYAEKALERAATRVGAVKELH
ncbi:hypothetical protein Poli38472_005441 [Pythium oligandrum]|uniref:Dephospho-CoA kinase n=1 Tax=Pythium oligandrum TaxID=41045 RepID=A0A8K1CGZ8_PYTOL|nr:hypothetical protein Poli38472_005441 [Pythium oligandrum]|eukprot:TMW62823.1 hypothetical protein Poli38472_005441 [Pythium oligandrum]